jgi:poly(beta-D-mannuronate) lyase
MEILNTIHTYPNPTSSILTIEYSLNDDLLFELFSIEGKKVLQKVLTEKRSKLNMSQLSKGRYFVRITQNKKEFSQQIMIGK